MLTAPDDTEEADMSERNLGRRDFVRLAAGGALALPALGARAGAQASGFPPRPERKKALFVYGGWDGHEPAKCRDLFVPWMQKTGFDVVVSDTQAPYADASLMKTIDVVVQIWTMGTIAKADFDVELMFVGLAWLVLLGLAYYGAASGLHRLIARRRR